MLLFDRVDERTDGRVGIRRQITQLDLESMEGPFNRNHADLAGRISQIIIIGEEPDQFFSPDGEQLRLDIIYGLGYMRLIAVFLGMLKHQVVGCPNDRRIQHNKRVLVQFRKSDRLFIEERVPGTYNRLIFPSI